MTLRATAANTTTATTRRGEGILRMEDAGTSEEDIDSQDSNTPIDHGHLARNCSIKIITPAVKASVISTNLCHKSSTIATNLSSFIRSSVWTRMQSKIRAYEKLVIKQA